MVSFFQFLDCLQEISGAFGLEPYGGGFFGAEFSDNYLRAGRQADRRLFKLDCFAGVGGDGGRFKVDLDS